MDPGTSPVSSASKLPFGRVANWPVTLAPFRVTEIELGLTRAGALTATSASGPATRSARFEITCTAIAALAGATESSRAANDPTVVRSAARPLPQPP